MTTRVTISAIGTFISSIPSFLTFTPTEPSFVVVTLRHAAGEPSRVMSAIRQDLNDEIPDLHPLLSHIVREAADAVAVAIIDPATPDSGHNDRRDALHRSLTRTLRRELGPHAIEVIGGWVTPAIRPEAPWWAVAGPARGTLPDPMTTESAAAHAVEGRVIHRDRAALESVLAPADPDRCAAVAAQIPAALARASRRVAQAVRNAATSANDEAEFALVLRQVASYDPNAGLAPAEAAALIIRLANKPVFERVMLNEYGDQATAAEMLWLELTRTAPEGQKSGPATLFGYSVYGRGEGILAAMAFDLACTDDPDMTMAHLLRQALAMGMNPAKVHDRLSAALV